MRPDAPAMSSPGGLDFDYCRGVTLWRWQAEIDSTANKDGHCSTYKQRSCIAFFFFFFFFFLSQKKREGGQKMGSMGAVFPSDTSD
jgi:hypothetical protein